MVGWPLAKELIKLGHEVEVLTGFPNMPQAKIYEGYHLKLLQKETLENVSVLRVPLYPSHDNSAVCRSANYVSFAFSAALVGPWVVKRADVAYVYHPPATAGLPASVLRILRGIPFVYDIKDLWPDTLAATGMFTNRFGLWAVGKWCQFIYKCASRIVVCTPGFKRKLCSRGVPPEKIEIIYNWCDDTQIHPVEPDEELRGQLGFAGCFNIVFAGNIGRAQGLDAVLEAARIIADRCPRVQFVFIGEGVEKDRLNHKARQMQLGNVRFLPGCPMSEIAPILSLADVTFAHLKDEPLFRITIPSRIQAYMSVGRPVLAGVRGDAADMVIKAQAGLKCEPENPQSIAEVVEQFYAMPKAKLNAMGENGKNFYKNEMALAIGARRFEGIFQMVAQNKQNYKGKTDTSRAGQENL